MQMYDLIKHSWTCEDPLRATFKCASRHDTSCASYLIQTYPLVYCLRASSYSRFPLSAGLRNKMAEKVRRLLLNMYRDKQTRQFMQRQNIKIAINGNFYMAERLGVQLIIDQRRAQCIMMKNIWSDYPQERRHMYHNFGGFEDQYKQVEEVAKPTVTPRPLRLGLLAIPSTFDHTVGKLSGKWIM